MELFYFIRIRTELSVIKFDCKVDIFDLNIIGFSVIVSLI